MSFFEELKRRKVFRVAATYAVVAWILMQIGEVTFPALNIPEWVMSTLVVGLLAGFPIVVIFAWVFDKTPQGYIKTDALDIENIGGMNVKVDDRPFYLQKRNIFLALGVIAGILIGTYGGGSFSSVDEKSIAVLPFDNYSTAEEDQYFSDGMTEVIIANLAKVKDLKVISRTSVMEYKNTTKKLKEIAKELGVAHILEGSIQRANGRVRVVGQLIDANTDEHIWAETYDRKETDIFDVQSDVALKIANAMKGELSEEAEKLIKEKPTDNIEAYDYFVQAQKYADRRTQNDLSLAILMLDKAIGLDKNFALAYSRQAYFILLKEFLRHGKVEQSLLTSVKNNIDLAMALAPDHPSIRAALGFYHYYGYRDYRKALIDFEFALSKEPSNSKHLFDMGSLYRRLGEWEKNIEFYTKAFSMDPNSISYSQNLSQSLIAHRDYDKALLLTDEMINRHPDRGSGYLRKIQALLRRDADVVSAKKVMEKAKLMTNSDNLFRQQLQIAFYEKDFESFISLLTEDTSEFYIGQWWYEPRFFKLGLGYELMGDKETSLKYYSKALEMLERKIEEMPADPRVNMQLGLVYSKLNRKTDAIRYGQIASSLLPVSRDHWMGGSLLSQLAWIQANVGNYEESISNLEYLSNTSSIISYGALIGSSNWDNLRGNDKFIKLIDKLKKDS
jgi:TolB-like protein